MAFVGFAAIAAAVVLALGAAVLIDGLSSECGGRPCSADAPEAVEHDGVTGPLALHRTNGFMQARNEGTLVIENACVFIERGGERALLVWPDDRTRWHEATRSIDFRTMGDVIVTMWNGDQIVLGGGTTTAVGLDWVVPPAAECGAGEVFQVGEVVP